MTSPPELSPHAARNREFWDRTSADYQREHGADLDTWEPGWSVWKEVARERDVRILGDVAGKDVLELGCGAAQWSIALARRGARVVGLDNSERQLEHARRLAADAGVDFPLVHASAEDIPLPGESFDVVFCVYGAITFTDPRRSVPEAARVLRPGGLFAFTHVSPLADTCWVEREEHPRTELVNDYFELDRFEEPDGAVSFQLPYGEWIRLFRRNGLLVEDLLEPRPPESATSSYRDATHLAWARRWPAEAIWVTRKASG